MECSTSAATVPAISTEIRMNESTDRPTFQAQITSGELAGLAGRVVNTPQKEGVLLEANSLGSGVYLRVPMAAIALAR